MEYGFGAPVSGPLSGVNDLTRIVTEGEAIGYDYCTLSDHVVIPRELEAKYPYSDTGEFPGRAGGDRHEQLTAATFVAAKTSKLRLVTSVMVVPHRPAVLTAKILATIDVLSEGRLTLGVGDGWYPIGTNPAFRLDTLERFKGGIERLHRYCRDAGRDAKEIALAYRVTQRGAGIPEKADNGDRRLFSGDNAAIVGDLRAFKELGVAGVDFSFDGANAGEVVATMRRFREDVLAKV